jgi:16S rRNA (guanine(966)-N(2))-methyltransferase RsmD
MKSAGEVRIIGGKFKRSLLSVVNKEGLRPTPNRVRETLFNWLGQDLSGWYCVDAFAGTGALGFEAASRGAASSLLMEQDRAIAAQLQATKIRLEAQSVVVQNGESLMLLARLATASQDLIFLDPPFQSDLYKPALIAATRIMKPSGFIYVETDHPLETKLPDTLGLEIFKQSKAGMVYYGLLIKHNHGQS